MRCAASATASTRDMGGRVALPTLAPDVLAHGARVAAYLRDCVMQAGGKLDFAEFMQQSLYAPGLGYYAAGMAKFGAQGDFVTAPEVSPLFAQSLAQQVAEILQRLGAGAEVLEFGAGSGALATELLLELERLEALPERYLILEVSSSLRALQHERLLCAAPHLLERVLWLDAWPQDFVGVMLGNEVLDAMPLRILQRVSGDICRLGVSYDAQGLVWSTLPASGEDMAI